MAISGFGAKFNGDGLFDGVSGLKWTVLKTVIEGIPGNDQCPFHRSALTRLSSRLTFE